jgi:hypothetical protein
MKDPLISMANKHVIAIKAAKKEIRLQAVIPTGPAAHPVHFGSADEGCQTRLEFLSPLQIKLLWHVKTSRHATCLHPRRHSIVFEDPCPSEVRCHEAEAFG